MNKFTVIAKKASFWEVVDGKQKRIAKARFDEILTQKIVKIEYRETETVYHVEERETIELFSFAELSEVVQNSIVEENRHILVDENWFDNVKDDFHETLSTLGFYNVESSFSGFSSQGDGASFTANWDAEKVVNNPEKWQSLKDFEYFKPYIDNLIKLGGKAQIKRNYSSLYVHAFTCYVAAENAELESVLEDLRLDCCNKYYRNLRGEEEYLTSDTAIKDYFFSCDWLKYSKSGLCVVNN